MEVMNMLKRVLLALLAIPILMIGSVAATEEDAGPPPVYVPVVLDGVKYSPEEFNELNRQLNGQAALIFVILADRDEFPPNQSSTAKVLEREANEVTLYAFSTEELYNAFAAARGLLPFERPTSSDGGEAKSLPPRDWGADVQQLSGGDGGVYRSGGDVGVLQVCPPPDPFWSVNYEHLNCGGAQLWVVPNANIPDLRNPCPGCSNWNDRITSVQAATGISHQTLFEHINFGGAAIQIGGGTTVPNLRDFGWNDRASSIQTR
jgi:hypothetical protein